MLLSKFMGTAREAVVQGVEFGAMYSTPCTTASRAASRSCSHCPRSSASMMSRRM